MKEVYVIKTVDEPMDTHYLATTLGEAHTQADVVLQLKASPRYRQWTRNPKFAYGFELYSDAATIISYLNKDTYEIEKHFKVG